MPYKVRHRKTPGLPALKDIKDAHPEWCHYDRMSQLLQLQLADLRVSQEFRHLCGDLQNYIEQKRLAASKSVKTIASIQRSMVKLQNKKSTAHSAPRLSAIKSSSTAKTKVASADASANTAESKLGKDQCTLSLPQAYLKQFKKMMELPEELVAQQTSKQHDPILSDKFPSIELTESCPNKHVQFRAKDGIPLKPLVPMPFHTVKLSWRHCIIDDKVTVKGLYDLLTSYGQIVDIRLLDSSQALVVFETFDQACQLVKMSRFVLGNRPVTAIFYHKVLAADYSTGYNPRRLCKDKQCQVVPSDLETDSSSVKSKRKHRKKRRKGS